MTTPKRLDFSSPPRLVLVADDDDDDDDAENNCPPLTRRTSQRQAAFKRPASSDAAVKEEEPKTKKKKKQSASSSSVKIWNEDDELTILKGLVEYRSKESIDPSTDWDGFFSYIKGLIHVKVSKEQLLSKIRKLKKKFLVITEKINNGEDPNFTKFTDPEAFKVSTMFWGENDAEDDKENADADAEPVNDNEAAKTNRDAEPRHRLVVHNTAEKKSDGKDEPGNNNFDGEALQQLVDKVTEKKTFGKKMNHDNEAGNSKSDDGKLLQQSTENKTIGKKMSHDNEAGTSKADGILVQQTVVDSSTENNTAAEESRDDDDDDVCTVQEAFETMVSQGLSEPQKKMQREELMNLETENRKELSNEWKEICSEETKLSAKKLRFSAKLVEAAIDG